ncbi:PDPFL protein, partial [Nothoprocta ornata]|nr:PDPFL protein [Nothoprocta pentlandii]NWY08491.1 PDPFL protein [Nothoprocta ornata]
MASVPSAGCLLAKNQYYRSKCPPASAGGSLGRRVQGLSELRVQLGVSDSIFCLLAGLPELIDKGWWIKSFFHCEPSPPTVGRRTLSAS